MESKREQLEEDYDNALRVAHDLHNELALYEEGSEEYYSVWNELQDAESEVDYFLDMLNQEGY